MTSPPAPPAPIAVLIAYKPGVATCEGQVPAPLHVEAPFVMTGWRPAKSLASPRAYTLSFGIDNDGRPHPMGMQAQDSGGVPSSRGFQDGTEDLGASLIASRFAAGAPRARCTISYTEQAIRLAEASPAQLYEVASAPAPGPDVLIRAIYDRLYAAGDDCQRGGPGSPRVLHYPAYEEITQPAGTRSWSFLRFDVDDHGRTRNVGVLGSSGNAALDRASVKAIRANRYAPGRPRHGCLFHFYRTAGTVIPAPALPDNIPADNEGTPACAIDRKTISSLLDGGAYPRTYQQRRIEGVAAVRYDMTRWGTLDNLEVLASEPHPIFGLVASNALYRAKAVENGPGTGQGDCVIHVRFKLPGSIGKQP